MKAKIINGKIVRGLPKFYTTSDKTYAGDFHEQPDSVHELEGFYPISQPSYNRDTEKIGEAYFDSVNNVFTRYVIDKDFSELKQNKLDELNFAKDAFLDNNFGEDESALRIVELYRSFGRLLNIIVTSNNIKNAVTNDQLLTDTYNLSVTLNGAINTYKSKRSQINSATTIEELDAIII